MLGDKAKKLVFIGSDHAGFKEKDVLHKHLLERGFDVTDLGTFTEESCDYPDIAREVGEKVREHKGAFGVLICGSGIGMCMAANKIQTVRAAVANDESTAALSRVHNDANVLCMGSRVIKVELMVKIADKFFATDFEKDEERRVRRVNKLDEM
ncbi:ribose 5-phosphate isomerase B [Candidatus Peregrinibacteria bacterium]|nr:ribose 5-phosphate isomerase B [Candidatus Peregrinibacteria bacterium]